MNQYEYLKEQYPETISLNQLYQICRISKRSASYLLQNKIIPCIENSANKTWRYCVALDDVITYLQQRDNAGSMIPRGATTSKRKRRSLDQSSNLNEYRANLEPYYTKINNDCPDTLLTVADISLLTGLSRVTIRSFIRDECLRAILEGNVYYIPKPWFLEYIQSSHFLLHLWRSDFMVGTNLLVEQI